MIIKKLNLAISGLALAAAVGFSATTFAQADANSNAGIAFGTVGTMVQSIDGSGNVTGSYNETGTGDCAGADLGHDATFAFLQSAKIDDVDVHGAVHNVDVNTCATLCTGLANASIPCVGFSYNPNDNGGRCAFKGAGLSINSCNDPNGYYYFNKQ